MPGCPLRSELKAITPPPLALSGGKGVELGEIGVGDGGAVVGGALEVAVKVGTAICDAGTAEGRAAEQPAARSAKINP